MQSVLVTKSSASVTLVEGAIYPVQEVADALGVDVEKIQREIDVGRTIEWQGVMIAPLVEGENQPST